MQLQLEWHQQIQRMQILETFLLQTRDRESKRLKIMKKINIELKPTSQSVSDEEQVGNFSMLAKECAQAVFCLSPSEVSDIKLLKRECSAIKKSFKSAGAFEGRTLKVKHF